MGRGSSERARQLAATGLTGQALFEALVSEALERKQARVANRCPRCWHDKVQRCICRRLGRLHTLLRVRVLVLMHSKEWMCASDDAKLLVAMLPADRVRLVSTYLELAGFRNVRFVDRSPEGADPLWLVVGRRGGG